MRDRRRSGVDVQAVVRCLIRGSRRAAVTVVGFVLVGVGLAGLLLPFLPGWILMVGGFALLSREYSWAYSCLRFTRKHAARGGTKLRTMAARRRSRARGERKTVPHPSGERVIDLTRLRPEVADSPSDSRSSQAL